MDEIIVLLGNGLKAHLDVESKTVFFSLYNVVYNPDNLTFAQIKQIMFEIEETWG